MNDLLNNWIALIRRNKTRSFWIAFAIFIVTVMGMRLSSGCLYSPLTPKAIVDLELAFDQEKALAIKESWDLHLCDHSFSVSSNGIETAVLNTFLDFPFIASYTWFLIVLLTISKTESNSKVITIGCSMIVIAGLLDVVENIFMLIFLKINSISSLLFAVPATLKFGTIIILVMWILVRLSLGLKARFKT